MEALAVAALAVLTGTSDSVHAVASLDELGAAIDLSNVSHNSAKFDEADLVALSARTLLLLPYEAVADRLAALGVSGPQAEADAGSGRCQRPWGWFETLADGDTYRVKIGSTDYAVTVGNGGITATWASVLGGLKTLVAADAAIGGAANVLVDVAARSLKLTGASLTPFTVAAGGSTAITTTCFSMLYTLTLGLAVNSLPVMVSLSSGLSI
jgi:hypothetical protein